MGHFIDWLDNVFRCPLHTAEEIDDALCEYGWWVYEHWAGRGKWRLNMALYGVEHFLPGLQDEMVLARRSLRGWDNLRPPQSHPPLNMALTSLLAAEMNRMGHPGAGVATLLAFDCYLRISEIAALRVCDVADLGVLVPHTYGQMRAGMSGTLITIPTSKTWENQSVQVRRTQVAALLDTWVRYVERRNGGDRQALLFPTQEQYRRLFQQAEGNLGWHTPETPHFVPHSLRHGGASCDYLIFGSGRLEEILFRGRWGSMQSTRHYIQQGAALMVEALTGVPRWQREYGHLVAQSVRYWITIPDDF